MSFGLFLPRRWTRQPQGPVEVDWGNPITRGLVAAVNSGSGPIEVVSRKPLLYGGFGTGATTDSGAALKSSVMVSYTDAWLIPVPRKSYSALSVSLRTLITNLGVNYPGFISGAESGSTGSLRNVNIVGGDSSGTDFHKLAPSVQIHGAAWNSYTMIFTAGSGEFDWRYFADGSNVRTIGVSWNKAKASGYGRLFLRSGEVARTGGSPQTVDSVWTNSTSSTHIRIGAGGTTYGPDQLLSKFGLWDRDLDPAEFSGLMDAPYQIFKPRRPVIYSFPSGGITIPTLSLPGVQDITATGARPKVTLTF